jgi:hypothetical protein
VDNGGVQALLPPATHAQLGPDEHETAAVKLEREDADMLEVMRAARDAVAALDARTTHAPARGNLGVGVGVGVADTSAAGGGAFCRRSRPRAGLLSSAQDSSPDDEVGPGPAPPPLPAAKRQKAALQQPAAASGGSDPWSSAVEAKAATEVGTGCLGLPAASGVAGRWSSGVAGWRSRVASSAANTGGSVWEAWLAKLIAYKAEHGDCNVPQGWAEDPSLGTWVAKQRNYKRKLDRGDPNPKMTAARIAKLEALGFAWRLSRGGSHGSVWEAWLAKLIAYKAEHGDCNVPQGWAEDPSLGTWVSNQRANKKKLAASIDRGDPNPKMTAARIAKLEALGFAWHAARLARDLQHVAEAASARWEAQLAKLTAYKAEHGDCNVPGRWAEDPGLGEWVKNQRTRKKKLDRGDPNPHMTAARAMQLEALGFAWGLKHDAEAASAQWEAQLAKLIEYKVAHGDCKVPVGWAEDPQLGSWVRSQRKAKKELDRGDPNPHITVARVAQLEALDFAWALRLDQGSWEAQLAKLIEYKAEYGDCNVPVRWAEDPGLGKWVNNQRKGKTKLDRGEPSLGMTAARAVKLDALDFIWVFSVAARGERVAASYAKRGDMGWEVHLAKLTAYKAEYGDCNVPRRWTEDPTLPKWVYMQRAYKKKLDRGEKSYVLTAGRMAQLDALGFAWALRDSGQRLPGQRRSWEVRLAKLTAYKAEHGHCNVPRGWAEDPTLGMWASSQRAYKNALDRGEKSYGMTAGRVAKLDALGFGWAGASVRNAAWADVAWESKLGRLVIYKAAHGDCNVPVHWAEDPGLGKWVSQQRGLRKKLDRGEPSNGMTAARAAKLGALGFTWTSRHQAAAHRKKNLPSRNASTNAQKLCEGCLHATGTHGLADERRGRWCAACSESRPGAIGRTVEVPMEPALNVSSAAIRGCGCHYSCPIRCPRRWLRQRSRSVQHTLWNRHIRRLARQPFSTSHATSVVPLPSYMRGCGVRIGFRADIVDVNGQQLSSYMDVPQIEKSTDTADNSDWLRQLSVFAKFEAEHGSRQNTFSEGGSKVQVCRGVRVAKAAQPSVGITKAEAAARAAAAAEAARAAAAMDTHAAGTETATEARRLSVFDFGENEGQADDSEEGDAGQAQSPRTVGQQQAQSFDVEFTVVVGPAGFMCHQDLSVQGVKPGTPAFLSGVCGDPPGMRLVTFNGQTLWNETWDGVKTKVKATPHPWTFKFKRLGDPRSTPTSTTSTITVDYNGRSSCIQNIFEMTQ